MREIQIEVENFHYKIPTLIILDLKDELVDSKKIQIQFQNSDHIKLAPISERSTQLPCIVHHLMIDKPSLGAVEWQKMLNILSKHFAL